MPGTVHSVYHAVTCCYMLLEICICLPLEGVQLNSMAHDLAMCSIMWSVIMSQVLQCVQLCGLSSCHRCCTYDLALQAHFDGTLLHALILLVQMELAFCLAFVYLT